MKNNWKYQDIIDLEYYFHQDISIDPGEIHERDRAIYLKQHQNQSGGDNVSGQDRPEIIRQWLVARNGIEFSGVDQRSPGKIFSDTLLLTRNIFFFKGIFLGAIAGLTFFTYTGTTPVNVFHFLLLFVVPQLALVALLMTVCLTRFIVPKRHLPSFYFLIIRKAVYRLTSLIHRQWLRSFSARKRASIGYAFGILKTRNTIYGSIFYWPFFGLSQLFGIGFNAGLLTVTLLKVLTSDLAFGWQSTIQLSGEAILQAVTFMALPWSWLIPQTCGSYPSLIEIEGSRIILKEGIHHLTTNNLIAWWPFLVLCLFTYGLLLRSGLFLIGTIFANNTFKKLRFDTPPCQSLVRRMQTALLSTQAHDEQNKKNRQSISTPQRVKYEPPAESLSPQIILIPDDIFEQCEEKKLAPLLQSRGLLIKTIHRFMVDYDTDRELLDLLSKKEWSDGEGLLVLMEGWMPPLVDFLSLLAEVRNILPGRSIIHLGLIGRPQSTMLTPVQQHDLDIWQYKISSLGDPYLTVFSLAD